MEEFRPTQRRFPADLARVSEARRFADAAAAAFGLDEDARYSIRLAMSEAVTNAIQHGSSSPTDPILVTVDRQGDALVFEVRDTGRFVPRVARRGDLPTRGRGLEFMRQLMDDVQLEPGSGGTLLRFLKRR
jgi:anti-sigma regulatory factor (Ser/Thr protein kinase)